VVVKSGGDGDGQSIVSSVSADPDGLALRTARADGSGGGHSGSHGGHGHGGDAESAARTASIGGSIINLTNTILGSGMLAFPLALNKIGVVFGVLLIILGVHVCV
jgi:hypothetical protein